MHDSHNLRLSRLNGNSEVCRIVTVVWLPRDFKARCLMQKVACIRPRSTAVTVDFVIPIILLMSRTPVLSWGQVCP